MKKWLSYILVIITLFALSLPFASENPDGLEKVIINAGVEIEQLIYSAPLSYGQTYREAFVFGLIGIGLAFGLTLLIARLVKAK